MHVQTDICTSLSYITYIYIYIYTYMCISLHIYMYMHKHAVACLVGAAKEDLLKRPGAWPAGLVFDSTYCTKLRDIMHMGFRV